MSAARFPSNAYALVVFYVFGVMPNGIFMVHRGYYMPWFLVSGILTTVGGALLYTS